MYYNSDGIMRLLGASHFGSQYVELSSILSEAVDNPTNGIILDRDWRRKN